MTQTVFLGATKIKDMPFRIIDGDRGANYPKGHEFTDDGFCLFLSAKNVTRDGFDFAQKQFITSEKDGLLRKGKLERDDVVLTTRGTVGNVALYDSSVPYNDVRINSGMVIIRCDKEKILPKYLYFVLKSGLFQNQVENFRSGSAQPQLPIRDMQNMKLPLPSLDEQENVVSQIGTIDEKIELNRQMNETLEQMGQALFRHYFIDNPEAEKWEDGIISDLGEVITGKTPSKSKTEYYGNDVMFLKVPDMHGQSIIIKTEDNLSVAGADTQPKKYIPKWSTCVSCIATVGVVSLAGDTLQTNQQINSVIPKSEEYAIFNYYLLKSKSELLKTMASGGSATLNLNKGHFEKVSIALPPDDILKAFHDKAKGMLEIVYENTRQIQTLTTLRDTLLPRLISGKVKVDD